MHNEHFDIVEIVQDVFDQFEGEAEKKEISLANKAELSEPVYVYADEQRIYQVMVNLVSNAIKYTKKEGSVTFSYHEEGDNIVIAISDTGKGIPNDDIKRIFERFYRIEKSRSKNKGGTGLGLAIVKHIIEAHHSKVQVSSTVGKGSTFSFKLPKGHPVQKQELNVSEAGH